MNCFEARQDFRSFWRKELTAGHRGAFVAHLADCSKCDAAFRTFALTAPVFHSESVLLSHSESVPVSHEDAESAGRSIVSAPRMPIAARREGRVYREVRRAPAWLSIAAVLALFVTGASAAYYAEEETPTETLSEAVHQPSQFVELVSADFPETNSDLGQ
jgi:hypothetical protein